MKKIIYICIILLLSGCAIRNLPPIKKYTIDNTVSINKDIMKTKNCQSIIIKFPQSSNEFFSKNIIYEKGLEKNAYCFSKWYETPNQMLYKIILLSLQKNQICRFVYPQGVSTQANYILGSEILDFSQNFIKSKSYAKVKILFYLKDKNGKVKNQKIFQEIVKCKTNNAIGGVEALNEAIEKLVTKFLKWINESIKN